MTDWAVFNKTNTKDWNINYTSIYVLSHIIQTISFVPNINKYVIKIEEGKLGTQSMDLLPVLKHLCTIKLNKYNLIYLNNKKVELVEVNIVFCTNSSKYLGDVLGTKRTGFLF